VLHSTHRYCIMILLMKYWIGLPSFSLPFRSWRTWTRTSLGIGKGHVTLLCSTNSDESFLSYYTANHEEPGTPTHPIDVDQLPDQPVTTNDEEMGTQTNPIDIDQYSEQPDTPYPRTNNVRRIHSVPLHLWSNWSPHQILPSTSRTLRLL
jgi:hypothetical protein